MKKDYNIPEDTTQQVQEPVAQSIGMNYRSDISRAITEDELKARLHEGLKSLFA